MANKNPRTDHLEQHQLKPIGEQRLGKIIGTRFPIAVEALLADVENHNEYIRQSVIEKLERDGLLPPSDRPLSSLSSVPPSDSSTDQTSEQSPDTPQKKADRTRNKSTMIP